MHYFRFEQNDDIVKDEYGIEIHEIETNIFMFAKLTTNKSRLHTSGLTVSMIFIYCY